MKKILKSNYTEPNSQPFTEGTLSQGQKTSNIKNKYPDNKTSISILDISSKHKTSFDDMKEPEVVTSKNHNPIDSKCTQTYTSKTNVNSKVFILGDQQTTVKKIN